MILLGLYLISVGLSVFGVALPLALTGILALVAGVLILQPYLRQ
jgi:hypothetical protein